MAYSYYSLAWSRYGRAAEDEYLQDHRYKAINIYVVYIKSI